MVGRKYWTRQGRPSVWPVLKLPLRSLLCLIKEEIQKVFRKCVGVKARGSLSNTSYISRVTRRKLSDESIHQLPEIISTISDRDVPDISVIGHTDRTASDGYNHQLSLRRANAIRNVIVAGGIDSQVIEVTGHGEYNPLVETLDDVNEPQNRRVEIIVR